MSATEAVKDVTVAAESAPVAAEATSAVVAPATPEDWKSALKIPPKDTRVKTEVIGGNQDFWEGELWDQHPGIGMDWRLGV